MYFYFLNFLAVNHKFEVKTISPKCTKYYKNYYFYTIGNINNYFLVLLRFCKLNAIYYPKILPYHNNCQLVINTD